MIDCQECNAAVAPEVRWQTFSNGSRHLRAECPHCRLFLRYLEQTEENKSLAKPPRPPVPSLFDQME